MMLENDVLDIIPTRAMLLQKKTREGFRVTVYSDPRGNRKPRAVGDNLKRPRSKIPADQTNIIPVVETKSPEVAFDMKRARHEILNFGIGGMESDEKEKAKIALAIKLGARPAKNPYKNYKELLQEKKDAKLKEVENEKHWGRNIRRKKKPESGLQQGDPRIRRRKDTKVLEHYGVVNPKIGKRK